MVANFSRRKMSTDNANIKAEKLRIPQSVIDMNKTSTAGKSNPMVSTMTKHMHQRMCETRIHRRSTVQTKQLHYMHVT